MKPNPIGRPLDHPQEGPKRNRSVRLTDRIWDAIRERAAQQGLSASEWIDRMARRKLGV